MRAILILLCSISVLFTPEPVWSQTNSDLDIFSGPRQSIQNLEELSRLPVRGSQGNQTVMQASYTDRTQATPRSVALYPPQVSAAGTNSRAQSVLQNNQPDVYPYPGTRNFQATGKQTVVGTASTLPTSNNQAKPAPTTQPNPNENLRANFNNANANANNQGSLIGATPNNRQAPTLALNRPRYASPVNSTTAYRSPFQLPFRTARTAQNCQCVPNGSYATPAQVYGTQYQTQQNGVAAQAPSLNPGQQFPPQVAPQPQPVLQQPNAFGNIGTPQFGAQGARWWTPFVSGSGVYTPLVRLQNMPPGSYLGQGIVGQPTAYVDGQPIRNLLRYLAP